MDLDAPIPNDIGIEFNHIGDGWDDNIYDELPSAADVNFLPSPADAMIPTPTETPGGYTQPEEVEYGIATEVARIFCIVGIVFTIES